MRDTLTLLPCTADGRDDRAVGRPPPDHEQLASPSGSSTASSGMSAAIPATFCAQPHPSGRVGSASYEIAPVTSAFSSPPIRCSSPAVRDAHGRASVSGSRRYGWNGSGRPRRTRSRCRGGPRPPGSATAPSRSRGTRREQVHGGPVLEGDAGCLDRGVEALGRASRRRRPASGLAVPAEEHHQQVGLLGLRRHPGRRARALDVEDDERQLARSRVRRSRPSGRRPARRRRHAERAAERRAERSADRGDLVLGLERDDASLRGEPRGSTTPV